MLFYNHFRYLHNLENMKKHNFSAGPSILPQEVFEKSAQAVLDFNGMGLSILEISHRSKEFIAVMEEARALVKKLMKLGDDYEVLFLQDEICHKNGRP